MTNDQNEEYFAHNYLGNDSTDITKNFCIKNTVGIPCGKDSTNGPKPG